MIAYLAADFYKKTYTDKSGIALYKKKETKALRNVLLSGSQFELVDKLVGYFFSSWFL